MKNESYCFTFMCSCLISEDRFSLPFLSDMVWDFQSHLRLFQNLCPVHFSVHIFETPAGSQNISQCLCASRNCIQDFRDRESNHTYMTANVKKCKLVADTWLSDIWKVSIIHSALKHFEHFDI